MTLSCVLVANRGEIACRVIRAAKRLGMRTIAIFSEADRDALHARLADEAVCIGPPPARESYLAIDRIVATARASGADCVHPGYGFLSENAEFAQSCADAGLVFVGPSASIIRIMGDKAAAKERMRAIGIPVLPGYNGARAEPAFLAGEAEKIGYPVLIKAVAGGGGKGIRRVDVAGEFAQALAGAQREAEAAFGDARVLIEKYVVRPRHVEVQIFGDAHGRVVHMFERDCSLQRRRQKIIEEAPAPGMSTKMRHALCAAAVRVGQSVGYVGAGTIEFIIDASRGLRPDGFWFMEMNTRLQVEHAVTEAVAGLDLVELQFRVAGGDPLGFSQEEIKLRGHAIEARLCAEDPVEGFLPSTGRIAALRWPKTEGARIDTGIEEGSDVSPYYDSLLAKIIARGRDRDDALARLREALAATMVLGPRCNLALLADLLDLDDFRAGRVDAGLVERFMRAASPARGLDPDAVAAGLRSLLEEARGAARDGDPWSAGDAFQLGPPRRSFIEFEADGRRLHASWSVEEARCRIEIPELGVTGELDGSDSPPPPLAIEPGRRLVWRHLRQTEVRLPRHGPTQAASPDTSQNVVRSPMPGRVARLFVKAGSKVEKGQPMAVVEAMKMEHELHAPISGEVIALHVGEGDRVALGAPILDLAIGEET